MFKTKLIESCFEVLPSSNRVHLETTDGSGFCNLKAHIFKLTFPYYPLLSETPEEMSHTVAVIGRGVAVLFRCWVSCLSLLSSCHLFYPLHSAGNRLSGRHVPHAGKMEMCPWDVLFFPLALRFVRTALNKQTKKHLELLRYFGIGNAAYFERPFSRIDVSLCPIKCSLSYRLTKINEEFLSLLLYISPLWVFLSIYDSKSIYRLC